MAPGAEAQGGMMLWRRKKTKAETLPGLPVRTADAQNAARIRLLIAMIPPRKALNAILVTLAEDERFGEDVLRLAADRLHRVADNRNRPEHSQLSIGLDDKSGLE
jgi:hypothetical protein